MKFGNYLKENLVKEWEFYYLSYNYLKKQIKKDSLLGTVSQDAGKIHDGERKFINFLDGELEKINSFYSLKGREIMEKLKKISVQIRNGSSDTIQKVLSEEEPTILIINSNNDIFVELERRLNEITDLYFNLYKYQQLNMMGFKKLLKKHDKHTNIGAKTWFMIKLEDQFFVKNDFDDILLKLSSTWKLFHKKMNSKSKINKTENVSSFNFVRKTTKYWVPVDKATEVKLAILKNLPISTFTSRSDSLITSVYYDTKDLEFYHQRLAKEEGSINLRMRTYGMEPYKTVYVERKTHHDSWTGEASIKQRFAIKEKHLYNFLHGKYTLDEDLKKAVEKNTMKQKEADDALFLSNEIQGIVTSKHLLPTMTTRYTRTAFQHSKSNAVRISLDTKLHMILEQNVAFQDGKWGRDLKIENNLSPNEIYWFPFDVLEIKLNLQMGDSEPDWVRNLIDCGHLIECGKFSKYMHGCVTLLPNECKQLPVWLSLLESCNPTIPNKVTEEIKLPKIPKKSPILHTQKSAQNEIKLDNISKNIPDATNITIEENLVSIPEKSNKFYSLQLFCQKIKNSFFVKKKQIATPIRVEPKTFFANERTFLHWLTLLFLIFSTGLIFIRISPLWQEFQIVGFSFIAISVFFLCYALFIFLKRRIAIKNKKKGPYDNVIGPFILVICLMAVVGLVIYASNIVYQCKGQKILINSFFSQPINGIVWDIDNNNLYAVGKNLVISIDSSGNILDSKIIPQNLVGISLSSSNSDNLYIASHVIFDKKVNTFENTLFEVNRFDLQVVHNITIPLYDISVDSFTVIPQTDNSIVFWIGSLMSDSVFVYQFINQVVINQTILVPVPGLIGYSGLSFNNGFVYGVSNNILVKIDMSGNMVKSFPIGLTNSHGIVVSGTTSPIDVYISDFNNVDIWKFKFDPDQGFLTGKCDDSSTGSVNL